MDKFEKLIKQSVESYEAPYSEAAWASMSEKLGPEKGGIGKWAIGGAIAAAAIIFGIWYFVPADKIVDSSAMVTELKIVDDNHTTADVKTADSHAEISISKNTIIETNKAPETKTEVSNQHTNGSDVVIEAKPNTEPTLNTTKQIDVSNGLGNIEPLNEVPLNDIAVENVDFSKFKLSAIADKLSVCVGEEVAFSPSIPKLKAKYQWEFNGSDIASGPYTSRQFETAGDYVVNVNLLDPKTNKIVNRSEGITIHVEALPQNEIAYEFDKSIVPRATFKQKNAFITSINWDIVGIYQTSAETFSYDFKRKGNYVVSCKVSGHSGCESTTNVVLNIENNYNLLAPNAFTPNGDNLNETFIPKALLITNTPFIMTIYDKSGKLVYETNDASRPWDGLYTKDLTPAPSGSYVWIVQVTNEANQVESYQGQVTIKR